MEKIVRKNWFLISENSVFRSPVIPFHQCFCMYRIGTLVQPTKEKSFTVTIHAEMIYFNVSCLNFLLDGVDTSDTGNAPNVLLVRFVILNEFQNIEKKTHCCIVWTYYGGICGILSVCWLPDFSCVTIFPHWPSSAFSCIEMRLTPHSNSADRCPHVINKLWPCMVDKATPWWLHSKFSLCFCNSVWSLNVSSTRPKSYINLECFICK